jgi:hypothetical protein
MKRCKLPPLAATAAAVLAAGTAHATVLASGSYIVNTTGTTQQLVPLTSDGLTSLRFSLARPTRVVISFSAECANGGVDAAAYTEIDIVVDGVQVPPTRGNEDVFCSGDASAIVDNWVTASVNVAVELEAGNHAVKVRARSSDDASTWWLGDVSTVVFY